MLGNHDLFYELLSNTAVFLFSFDLYSINFGYAPS